MAVFASPELAMRAALNAELPKEKRMRFRMGINMVHVVVDGDDLHGDGVKVAARLESLASPECGICRSESVRQQVKSILQFPFRIRASCH